MTPPDRPTTTTDAGIPASSDEHSLTVGPDGPILLQDHYVVQKMAQFNRERVPERVVHAKGGGAHGFFEVTEDATQWCSADFLSAVGKKVPAFVRFSTVAGELGSADTVRDPRGFAIKLYTGEGNYDIVGNNTPVFFVKDPSKFQDFIHSQKRMPSTNRRSNEAQWDFWTLSPESAHQVTILMSDRGTPKSWRHMNGYSSHTFLWQNAGGERFWVKYHFKAVQGTENFTDADAKAMTAEEPDYHLRDLYDAIEGGDAPEWRLDMQIMPFDDAPDYRFNPFDLTKIWSHEGLPADHDRAPRARPQPGELLRRGRAGRVRAGEPGAGHRPVAGQDAARADLLLPGHAPSPDRHQLPAAPDQLAEGRGQLVQQGRRDALPPQRRAAGLRAELVRRSGRRPGQGGPGWGVEGGEMIREAYTLHSEDDDFGQPGTLVRDVMSDADRENLAGNVAGHLSQDVTPTMQQRALAYWGKVDANLASAIASKLGVSNGHGGNGAPGAPDAGSPSAEPQATNAPR